MIPRRKQIIGLIPPPSGSEEFVTDIQSTDDILMCVYDSVRNSEGFIKKGDAWVPDPTLPSYVKNYAPLFLNGNTTKSGDVVTVNVDGVCNDIWDFMQNQWPYDPGKAETELRQTGRTVRQIIYTINPRKFDCKHYATFAFATLRALGIPCNLRLTSYDMLNPSPSHIYVVAGVGDYDPVENKYAEEFIIDGTMPEYDQESKNGVTQYYKVKILP